MLLSFHMTALPSPSFPPSKKLAKAMLKEEGITLLRTQEEDYRKVTEHVYTRRTLLYQDCSTAGTGRITAHAQNRTNGPAISGDERRASRTGICLKQYPLHCAEHLA